MLTARSAKYVLLSVVHNTCRQQIIAHEQCKLEIAVQQCIERGGTMRKIFVVLALLASSAVVSSSAVVARGAQSWAFEYRPFKGSYFVYGGSLGDTTAPTKRSRNIAYSVEGPVARR